MSRGFVRVDVSTRHRACGRPSASRAQAGSVMVDYLIGMVAVGLAFLSLNESLLPALLDVFQVFIFLVSIPGG